MSIEQKFFTWGGCDILSTGVFQFYQCTTVMDIGRNLRGSSIPTITMDYESSVMSLHKLTSDNDMTTEKYKIELLLSQ